MLIDAVLESDDCVLSGALDRDGSPALGHDPSSSGASGVIVTADLRAGLAGADVLIDFTRPEATLAHLGCCRELGVAAVIGTTGFSQVQRADLAAFARELPMVVAPNMSVGINVVLGLLALAAGGLGEGYDIEVVETHHRNKVDAPSGTALAMGEVLAAARGVSLDGAGVFSRHGHTGARPEGAIGFAALRGGDIVGDHTVLFAGIGERVEITHRSTSRANYAEGSLRAARFVVGKPFGLYDMADVLGLPGRRG
jgi:4-hydroxy-tetrahydrodipicolinate reductase